MRTRLVALLAATALAPLALACGGDEETSDSQTIEPSAVTVEQDIEVGDLFFKPEAIDATLGNTIVATLASEAEQTHTFTIDEFLVDEQVDAGNNTEVTFTPNEPGEFTFYCRIHPETMQGTLRIARPGEQLPSGEAEESPTEDASDGGYGY
jgi:plastocyanin